MRRWHKTAADYLREGHASLDWGWQERPTDPVELAIRTLHEAAERELRRCGVRTGMSTAVSSYLQSLMQHAYVSGDKPDHVWFAEPESEAKFVEAILGIPYEDALRRINRRGQTLTP